jgi:hypothetical protein
MQQREWITMTAREQRRAHILTRVVAGELELWEAAVVLGLSIRQARRLKHALLRDAPAGLAHANRGTRHHGALSPGLQQHIIELYLGTYRGLNHQHFCDLLAERELLLVSVASVRPIAPALRRSGQSAHPTSHAASHPPRAHAGRRHAAPVG